MCAGSDDALVDTKGQSHTLHLLCLRVARRSRIGTAQQNCDSRTTTRELYALDGSSGHSRSSELSFSLPGTSRSAIGEATTSSLVNLYSYCKRDKKKWWDMDATHRATHGPFVGVIGGEAMAHETRIVRRRIRGSSEIESIEVSLRSVSRATERTWQGGPKQ